MNESWINKRMNYQYLSEMNNFTEFENSTLVLGSHYCFNIPRIHVQRRYLPKTMNMMLICFIPGFTFLIHVKLGSLVIFFWQIFVHLFVRLQERTESIFGLSLYILVFRLSECLEVWSLIQSINLKKIELGKWLVPHEGNLWDVFKSNAGR